MDEGSFKELFESSIRDFHVGQIVQGKVVNINKGNVFIDVGYKAESCVPIDEFDEEPSIGEAIRVMVMKEEDQRGRVLLSKKQADLIEGTQKLKQSYAQNTPVQGKITKEIKGGYLVSLGGVEAFLPASHLDVSTSKHTQEYLGQRFLFKIEHYDAQKNNVVVSRKKYLEEELQKKRDNYLKQLKEGDIIEGTVKYLLPHKVIVNIQDILTGDVLLKDLSWTRIKDSRFVLRDKQRIQAKVLSIDREASKLQLGLKQLVQDPLEDFTHQHKIGDIMEGKVVHLKDFGAFVQFIEGVEGLIHISELSWTKKISHPKEVVKRGDHVTVKLLDIDKENRKVSLSLRQINPNPWATIETEYPRGKRVKGKIVNVEEFGVFVSLSEEIVGLLHKTNIDWLNEVTNAKEHERFHKGADIDVIILDFDKANQTISLGMKQLLKNPYEVFKANHPKNSPLKVTIKAVHTDGLTVDLGDGLEGFVPASETTRQSDQTLSDMYTLGQELDVVIKNIDLAKSKVMVSLKDYEKQEERQTIQKYVIHSKELQDQSISLGEIISLKNLNLKK